MDHARADRILSAEFGHLLVGRDEWNALEVGDHPHKRNLTPIDFDDIDSLVVHHWGGAIAPDTPTLAESAAAVRATQRYHLDWPNGARFIDIAYNWTVDHAGRLFICRGWHLSGATAGANGHTWAVALHGHYGKQRPTDQAIATVHRLRRVVTDVKALAA